MEKASNTELSTGKKLLFLLFSAVTVGFMWRVRGAHGFGSMWGMFCVGVMLILMIFATFGEKIKCRYEYLPIAVFLLGITNGGWGTLNSQMGGYLTSTAPFSGQEFATEIPINHYSGLVIMLLLGFGWMPLFSVFVGSLFSKRDYKFKDIAIYIAIYYVVMLILQASLSHPLMQIINPEAVSAFKEGLADAGHDLTPFKAYIVNAGSAAWAKKVPFGRNYFTSIEVISSALSALVTSLCIRFFYKDKVTARVSTAINGVCALSITLADVFLIWDSDRGFLANISSPAFVTANGWSLWEFFTGFLLGFGIMLVLLVAYKYVSKNEDKTPIKPFIQKNKLNVLFNSLFTLLFTFGVTLLRPFGMRLASVFTEEDDVPGMIITIIISVIMFFPCLKTVKKNMTENGLNVPVNLSVKDFAAKYMLLYFLGISGIFFSVGSLDHAYIIGLPFKEMFSNGILKSLNSGVGVMQVIVIIAFIIFMALYKVLYNTKQNNNNK